jgi:Flp pilus assembly protein TadD
MIRKAVELRPNDGNIVDSLGWALYKLGRYDQAVEQLEHAVLLRPEVPEINEHLGDAYWRVGRILEARFQWSHAIDLGGDGTNIDILEAKRDTRPGGNPFAHDGD